MVLGGENMEKVNVSLSGLLLEISQGCNRLMYGQCTTLACLKRGGYKLGDAPVDINVSTCTEFQAVKALSHREGAQCRLKLEFLVRKLRAVNKSPHEGVRMYFSENDIRSFENALKSADITADEAHPHGRTDDEIRSEHETFFQER